MKITTAEIQKNDYSAMSFYGVMNYAVKQIRETIGLYKELRKVDTSILGCVHALSLLCEQANNFDVPINLKEADEWKEILLKYFDRIQKKVPEEIREDFRKNLQKDLETILSKGKNYPEHLWLDKYYEREITIRVKNEDLKSKYLKLAEENERYKGKRGNALHNYLHDCLEKLEPGQEELINQPVSLKQEQIAFKPVYFKSNSDEFTYLLSDFSFFIDEKQLKNEIEINAFDIEKAIKSFLESTDQDLLNKLRFDTESSLLSVQANDIRHLIKLNDCLLQIATNKNIKSRYLKIGV